MLETCKSQINPNYSNEFYFNPNFDESPKCVVKERSPKGDYIFEDDDDKDELRGIMKLLSKSRLDKNKTWKEKRDYKDERLDLEGWIKENAEFLADFAFDEELFEFDEEDE